MERSCILFLLEVLLLLQSCMVSLAINPSNVTDQSALLAFKKEITFDPSNTLARNWTTETNFCHWFGVSCSTRRQRITALELPHMGLQGTISPYIGNLSFLVLLDLSNNSFHGHLAQELCHLRRLKKLLLFNNQLSGSITSIIFNNTSQMLELRILALDRNRFEGTIPKEIGSLPMLQGLYLGRNNISGTIPPSLANNSRLEDLGAEENNIHGKIPDELGSLSNLVTLFLGRNDFKGMIPKAIFNISVLQALDLSWNSLSGNLPSTMGIWLPNLQELYLQVNKLWGELPLHLSNSSKFIRLHLESNLFTGQVPINLGDLQQLEEINLGDNMLKNGPANSQLKFLTSLTNCRSLNFLDLDLNPLNGFMPNSIGNHSSPLQILTMIGCQIQGHIPKGIGFFKKLYWLRLGDNGLNGTIPATIGGLESLQRLGLAYNMLEGLIPNELCHLRNMGEMLFDHNKLSGQIPTCIGNLNNLQNLDLSSNRLNSLIPFSLWTLKNLILLNLSANFLNGYIPQNAKLEVIEVLDLSSNQISGDVPSIIGALQRLRSLNLSKNSLQGPIPQTFGSLVALEFLDLSYNNFSGAIPKSLEALKYLRQLNLSFNKLSGEIPSKGPFKNFTAKSFFENEALCGNPVLKVPSCSHITSRSSGTQIFLKYVLPAIASLATLVAFFYFLRAYQSTNAQVPNPNASVLAVELPMISYYDLVRATDNFSEANLLGVGSIGSVYKGILSDGIVVAVKVLNLQLEGALKSFNAECKVLRTIRHRNLVKVISSCSNPEFKALILKFMSNGSLEKWLYSHNYFLNLIQRVCIMVDVAVAVEYLHFGLPEPVIHCDLKPNNVLIDEEMVAHVADFGIAKILAENKTTTQTKTLGTLGYIAPEYGSEGRVSTKCDIYSYGIMLLELLTRKKPADEMFFANMSLRQWVHAAFPDNIMEVVDNNLLRMEDEVAMFTRDHLLAIFELGLDCSKDSPEERSDIKDVTVRIKKIKSQLLSNS